MAGAGATSSAVQRCADSPRQAAVSRPVVHRITTSTAAVVNDPSPAQLTALIAEVERSGRGSFLIAERSGGRAGGSYLQAVRHPSGWQLEVVDGRPEQRFRVELPPGAAVEHAFTSWTRGSGTWRQLSWERVARDSGWLPAPIV